MSKLNTKLKILSLVVFGISMLTSNASASTLDLKDGDTLKSFKVDVSISGEDSAGAAIKVDPKTGKMTKTAMYDTDAENFLKIFDSHTSGVRTDKFDSKEVKDFKHDVSKTSKSEVKKAIEDNFLILGYNVSDVIADAMSGTAVFDDKTTNKIYKAIEQTWKDECAKQKSEIDSAKDISPSLSPNSFNTMAVFNVGDTTKYKTNSVNAEFSGINSEAIIKYLKIEFTDTPEKRAAKLMKALYDLDGAFTYTGANDKKELIDEIRSTINANYKSDNKSLVNNANKLIASIFCQVIHANVLNLKDKSTAGALFAALGIKDKSTAKNAHKQHKASLYDKMLTKLTFDISNISVDPKEAYIKITTTSENSDGDFASGSNAVLLTDLNTKATVGFDNLKYDSTAASIKNSDAKADGAITIDLTKDDDLILWKDACKNKYSTGDAANIIDIIKSFLETKYKIKLIAR